MSGGHIVWSETYFKPASGGRQLNVGDEFVELMLDTASAGFELRIIRGVLVTVSPPWESKKSSSESHVFATQTAAEHEFDRALELAREDGFWLAANNVLPHPPTGG
jgi:hypothetical protein